ncbi:NAD(P)H-binding protein [Neolewinella antarctica]|uniref:Nucleoside-diphosphate-sugar epimerase n=1 Tax=Neolewinella antarctica TaxID=442734 RepID=A0ABX0XBQ9_9BACT|nr:NAD(P)H-binding protein [Neolewinella antarctica]NJC26679.1 nucleoside-diphosphate-sugar epimerase [Neolewinella antarctica]
MSLPTIVIAGATGFIGRWFIERFHQDFNIIALSRSEMEPDPTYDHVDWRQVELYSLSSSEEAMKGADYALYLVHSMHPTTRLHQGTFEDTDLLLADNFGRAAKANGLKQIIFMGGLLPYNETKDQLSRHLRSRWEVEQTLGNAGVPVTTLRAGIIVGPGGSSFDMIKKLVERLPVMICPSWCQSETHPIELEDALKIIRYCVGQEDTYDQHFDIGGGGTTTYMEMMRTVADLMNKKRTIRPVHYFSPGFSKMWVALFTNQSRELVSPLIESLRHDMVATPNSFLEQFPDRADFRAAAHRALYGKERLPALPKRIPTEKKEKNTVRSVQRLANPEGHTATYVARIYQKWLPIFFRTLIRVRTEGDVSDFTVAGVPLLQLTFISDRSDEERQLFYITGGRLVKRRDYGWLEFRRVLGGRYVISAIHEFVPSLPWFLYVGTQARAHSFVMNRFGKYLAGD